MDDKELREQIKHWLEDESPQPVRMTACRIIAAGLGSVGRSLNAGGYIYRDDAMRGLGVVIEMGAELANGAVQLLDQELWYAGGSLLRQLIEVEYLTSRFSEDWAAAASETRSIGSTATSVVTLLPRVSCFSRTTVPRLLPRPGYGLTLHATSSDSGPTYFPHSTLGIAATWSATR